MSSPPKPLILIRTSAIVLPFVVATLTACFVLLQRDDTLLKVLAVASNAVSLTFLYLARRNYTITGRITAEQRQQLLAAGYAPKKQQLVKRLPPFPLWVEVARRAD